MFYFNPVWHMCDICVSRQVLHMCIQSKADTVMHHIVEHINNLVTDLLLLIQVTIQQNSLTATNFGITTNKNRPLNTNILQTTGPNVMFYLFCLCAHYVIIVCTKLKVKFRRKKLNEKMCLSLFDLFIFYVQQQQQIIPEIYSDT